MLHVCFYVSSVCRLGLASTNAPVTKPVAGEKRKLQAAQLQPQQPQQQQQPQAAVPLAPTSNKAASPLDRVGSPAFGKGDREVDTAAIDRSPAKFEFALTGSVGCGPWCCVQCH